MVFRWLRRRTPETPGRSGESPRAPAEPARSGTWRPGPHGAVARDAAEEEAIRRAYARAEAKEKSFHAIVPRQVTAAEAVTSHSDEHTEVGPRTGHKSRACFVATAAYGCPDAPEVERLRRFRDEVLLKSTVGTLAVRAYYRLSPPVARLIAGRPRLRTAVRRALDVLVNKAAL